jgi:hypothetical protein
MGKLPIVDVQHFQQCGYCLLKGVFSPEEIGAIRARLEMVKTRALRTGAHLPDPQWPKATFVLGDVLAHKELEEFDYVVFDERIVACVRQLIGEDLVYFGDSSMQTGEGARGFHKDNVDRNDGTKPDWQGEYTLVRIGLYYQDHSLHSGGLKVRLKSNLYPNHLQGKAYNIPTQVGDVVMWSLRTTHSGNNVRCRLAPNVCLHPRLEAKLPPWLRVPEQQERFATFCTFGRPDHHLERYLNNLVARGDQQDYLVHAGLSPKILELARRRGITMRPPVPEYGSKYAFREGAKAEAQGAEP